MPCPRNPSGPCPGPEGALERQCAWCRRTSRAGNRFTQLGSDLYGVPRPTVELKKYRWTDQYLAKQKHDASISAVADPAVRFVLPLLREKTATPVHTAPTPRFLLHLSQIADREIGLLTDAGGGGNLYLTIGTATGITTPSPKSKYRFLVHTHPTYSTRRDQITGDMKHASDDVEMVVTMGELIVLYSEGKCYNPRIGDDLQPLVKVEPAVTMDTRLDATLFRDLTLSLNPPRTAQQTASSSSGDVGSWLDFLS